jgi:hypothetical protein
MTTAINKSYIYECDLKQFFPSVDCSSLINILETKLKLPIRISNGLSTLNAMLPVLPNTLLLPEKYTVGTDSGKMKIILEEEWDYRNTRADM